jgi:hypothetical protein
VPGSQELTPTILTPPVGGQNQFSVSTNYASQGEVIVTYRGIAGNQPGTYKNNLALWNGSLPNMTVQPLQIIAIESNNQPNFVVEPKIGVDDRKISSSPEILYGAVLAVASFSLLSLRT